jgi:CxxC motif-containing protein (DUF1111 family)
MRRARLVFLGIAVPLLGFAVEPSSADPPFRAVDPGVREGAPGAGDPLPGLTASQMAAFEAGRTEFEESEEVGDGLGPRFNLDSCLGCHAQPAAGGSSPAVNPQIEVAGAFGARNAVPPFLSLDGPVREVRYKYKSDGSRDGGVHALFVTSGRVDESGDASGCDIQQEDFAALARTGNLVFRIPTPLFGAGLIEQIPDSAILANASIHRLLKASLGIRGRAHRVRLDSGTTNLNGNDGTVARFGWKAQNKSLLLFAGEAYNVEMGVSNELFPTERDETPDCQLARTPNDTTNPDGADAAGTLSGIEKFALFMRLLAPPAPSPDEPGGAASIARGRELFAAIGCADCHTPSFETGDAAVEVLRHQTVPLYSDLLLHQMGSGLADDIAQGQADPDEFRTAPLWGLGQRVFFLHDGRTRDLREAIAAHRSGPSRRFRASEANRVVDTFEWLSEHHKQDVLNFLRSL